MKKFLSLFAAFLFAASMMAAPVALPAVLDVTNVSFRSEGMPDFVIEEGQDYAGTYFDMGAHDSSNDTLLYAEWDVTIEPIKYNLAVDVYNTNSWRVQLYLLNQAGDTVKDLRYKGSSGQKGQFAIGSLDLSDLAAGNYKLRARAATAWSAMKLKDIVVEADYQGVSVQLPGILLPAYAELSSGASITNKAIAFKPSTANEEYAIWNVEFKEAGDFNVYIDMTASNGHTYGVALLSADGKTGIDTVAEAQSWDTGVKELGKIAVPAAGKYVVKLTNATQWSEAVMNSIGIAPAGKVLADGFYLLGKTGWDLDDVDSTLLFKVNPANDKEYILHITLAEKDSFKIVKVEDDGIVAWYPDQADNYAVDAKHAGEKDIYFRPDGQGGEGWYHGVIYIAANEPDAKFYVTGDSALVADGGAPGKAWDPSAIKSMNDTLVLNLKADVDYVLKVTLNGTWEGENNVKGYNELSEKTPGLKDEGNDHNIGFKLNTAGEVKVIYAKAVPNDIFKLEGDFYVEPAEGCDWTKLEWIGGPAEYANQFKVCKAGEQPGIVNIQQPGFAKEVGIYMTFPSAAFGEISLDTAKYAIQGAGIVFYLSAFKEKVTDVAVVCEQKPILFSVYNEKGIEPVEPKFYVTGDSALVTDGGAAGKAWNPAAIPSMNDTLVLNLKANVDYVLKVTLNGTWDGENNVKGYNELSEKTEGLKDISNDHNIGFKLNKAGEVKVIYAKAVPNDIFKLEGDFYVEPEIEPADFSKPFTLRFNGTNGSNDDSNSFNKDSKIEDIFEAPSVKFISAIDTVANVYKSRIIDNDSSSLKFGTSSKKGILAFTLGQEIEVDSIVVNATQYGNNKAEITINDSVFELNAGNKVPQDCKVVLTGKISKITIAQSASERLYLRHVAVYPKAAPEPKHTYTVAGSPSVFGSNWNPADTINDMKEVEKGIYLWAKNDIALAPGNIEFKICEDHAWTKAWPAQNYVIKIDSAGLYTVAIYFTTKDDSISAMAIKTGEAVVIPKVILHGDFTGSWADTKEFTLADDSLSASLKLNLGVKNYEFGMKFDGTWKANGAALTRENPSTSLLEGSGNMHINADVEGEYLFTYTFADEKLAVTYPEEQPGETIPSKAPAKPTAEEDDVLAIYCNHYTTNNLNFGISGWAGAYQVLDLEGTNVGYWTAMTWECIIDPAHTDDAHDLSGYKKLHVDLWAPKAAKIKFTVEAVAGGNYKDGVKVDLAAGWNSFDFVVAEWTGNYDFKNVKCFVFEQYQTPAEESFEGNPFAFTNIYLYDKESQAIDNTDATVKAVKVMENGQILIIKNGKTYNVLGTLVK